MVILFLVQEHAQTRCPSGSIVMNMLFLLAGIASTYLGCPTVKDNKQRLSQKLSKVQRLELQ